MRKFGEVWIVYKVVLEVVINGFWLFVCILFEVFVKKVCLESCYFWFLGVFYFVNVEVLFSFFDNNREYLRFFGSEVLVSVVGDMERFCILNVGVVMDVDIGGMDSKVLE